MCLRLIAETAILLVIFDFDDKLSCKQERWIKRRRCMLAGSLMRGESRNDQSGEGA